MRHLIVVAGFALLLSTAGGCASMGCCGGSSTCDSSCNECSSCKDGCNGACSNDDFATRCGGGARGMRCGCQGGVSTGCRPGALGWQQGGSDYAHHLTYCQVKRGDFPQTKGPPSPTVGYPYYTNRGPRDFLVADPPSIGY